MTVTADLVKMTDCMSIKYVYVVHNEHSSSDNINLVVMYYLILKNRYAVKLYIFYQKVLLVTDEKVQTPKNGNTLKCF